MGRTIRKMSRKGYAKVAKPFLFRRQPDAAHQSMLWTARALHAIRGEQLLSGWRYKNPRLEQTILGLNFVNPIGLSAGLDKDFDLPSVAKKIGCGFEIGGSVTAVPCEGNPKPWFRRLASEQSIVVNVGLANRGVAKAIEQIRSYSPRVWRDFPLSVSVAKTNSPKQVRPKQAIADYCDSLRQLEEAGCSPLYEINISCPNAYGGEPFTTPARLKKLLTAVDELKLSRPVFIKMPTDKTWTQFAKLLSIIDKHNVAGLTIGNLVKDRSKLTDPSVLPDDTPGSLSGRPAQAITTRLIHKTYALYGDRFVIIGVGGVFTAEDAYEKIRAGASLVALVTALMFEGPQVVGDINEGLVELLDRDDYVSISEAIGAAHRK